MSTPTWVQEIFEDRGINYVQRTHVPSYTAQALAEREHISGYDVGKVVVVKADGKPMLLVLPAPYEVDLDAFEGLIDAEHVRLATEGEIADLFPDCELGAVVPLPHYGDDVGIWMDETMTGREQVTFAAGTHEDCVTLSAEDWRAVAKPRVGRFAMMRH